MPNNPEYSTYHTGVQGYSLVHGVEYEEPVKSGLHSISAPCAVYHVPTREAVLMIPAKLTSSTSWAKEYSESLMISFNTHKSATVECVDSSFVTIPGSGANTNEE